MPEPFKNVHSLSISCSDIKFGSTLIDCQQGKISISGLFDDVSKTGNTTSYADFKFNYDRPNKRFYLSVESLKVDQAQLSFEIHQNQDNWKDRLNVSNLAYRTVDKYLDYYLKSAQVTIDDPDFIINISGSFSGTFDDALLTEFDVQGSLENLKYTMGDNLAENLSTDFKIWSKKINKNHQEIAISLENLVGELFQNDIYLTFQGNERLNAKIQYDNEKQFVDIQQFKVTFPAIIDLDGAFIIGLKPDSAINQIQFTVNVTDFKQFNDLYLRNILEGTDYEGLEIEGGLEATFKQQFEKYELKSKFEQLSLSYNEQINVVALDGSLNWNNRVQAESEIQNSQLRWEELVLNDLPFGQSNLSFRLHNEKLKLLKEADIPLFDGALHINTLDISHPGLFKETSNAFTLTIDGMIKPISLEQVSSHFNWPLLDGQLSAVIPSTTYNEHFLSVGGAMMLQVFDGTIIIKDLNIEQPLSESARMYANIDLNNLNLKSLTKTYNFGEIEGRIEGKFKDLILDSWQPIQFDAYFRTPENDKSRHRISQRAIDNLSSLGGASGLLSRSFLSFFETFGYDKLGLSCKLKNSICIMDGIESKSGDSAGYYIVKGGGVLRIDVMGFQRKVNWQVLTSRLQAIQSANEAVIE